MKVLGAVQLIGPVKKEVARLVSHRWKKSKEKTCEVQPELQSVSVVEPSTPDGTWFCRQEGLTENIS